MSDPVVVYREPVVTSVVMHEGRQGPQGPAGASGPGVLALEVDEDVPENTPRGTVIVRF